jgi:polyisoprenoid-binding protein YceI
MRFSFLFALIGFLLAGTAPAAIAAAPADSTTFQFHDESTMTVHGSSNVRDWTMDVETMSGSAVFEVEGQGTPAIHAISVEVPVEALVAGRSSMQEKAHKALKKEEYPTVQFRSDSVVVATAEADSFAVIANGDLTIAGETRAVTVRAKGAAQGADGFHVRGEHELELSTFNVERPSALLGALTVSDGIRLTFDMVLRRQ